MLRNEDGGGDEDDSSQVGLVGRLMRVRKGELVIVMLERVAELMRVRRKKKGKADLRNYLEWDQHFPAGAIAAVISAQCVMCDTM